MLKLAANKPTNFKRRKRTENKPNMYTSYLNKTNQAETPYEDEVFPPESSKPHSIPSINEVQTSGNIKH